MQQQQKETPKDWDYIKKNKEHIKKEKQGML